MLPKLLKTTEQYTADTGHLSGVDTGWAVGGAMGKWHRWSRLGGTLFVFDMTEDTLVVSDPALLLVCTGKLFSCVKLGVRGGRGVE